MPNASDLEVRLRRVAGTWGQTALDGPGMLRLREHSLELVTSRGVPIVAAYDTLSGAGWRTGKLFIHSAAGVVELEGEAGLERAWVALTALSCPIPEFTRGLRTLGSRRSLARKSGAADAAAQTRFFAPLLQARRRLEQEGDLDRRLTAFEAPLLAERMTQVLALLAAEYYPASPPDRRALEAELLEAVAPLLEGLDLLKASEERYRGAADDRRFVAWRGWTRHVAAVFAAADRSWRAASPLLPVAPAPPRSRWRGGRGAGVLFVASLGAVLGALR
jgi:hypothetical protein